MTHLRIVCDNDNEPCRNQVRTLNSSQCICSVYGIPLTKDVTYKFKFTKGNQSKQLVNV